jgi:hypothetical protein
VGSVHRAPPVLDGLDQLEGHGQSRGPAAGLGVTVGVAGLSQMI